jgi:hypothetical protein
MTNEVLDLNMDFDDLLVSKTKKEVEETSKRIKQNFKKEEEIRFRKTISQEINKLDNIDLHEYEYPSYKKTIFTNEPDVKTNFCKRIANFPFKKKDL